MRSWPHFEQVVDAPQARWPVPPQRLQPLPEHSVHSVLNSAQAPFHSCSPPCGQLEDPHAKTEIPSSVMGVPYIGRCSKFT
jgi:hypothetical protein